jgi:hypothetical protein
VNRYTCSEFQHLLKSGALLTAGVKLNPADQQLLQEHLKGCATCYRLSSSIETLDEILRDGLHARRALVPRSSRELPRIVIKRVNAKRMSHGLKMAVGSVLGVMVFAMIILWVRVPTVSTLNGPKIIQNPGAYMLRYEDLPVGIPYYTPGEPLSDGIPLPILETNESLTRQLGSKRAAKTIDDTDRLTGWRVVSQRADTSSSGPDTIRNWLWVHETERGAQRAVTEYVPGGIEFQSYEKWQTLGEIHELGDIAAGSRLIVESAPNFQWVTYRVDFAYHQVSVRVELTDRIEQIQLVDALRIAHRIFDRLKEAEENDGRP